VVLTSTDLPKTVTAGDSLTQGATNQVILRFDMRTDYARAGFDHLTLARTGTSSDSDVAGIKIWSDKVGNGRFDAVADAPPLGSGTFGNPPNLAQINFDSITYNNNLNDLTTGPLKIDTKDRYLNTYFITYDIAELANPQMTLGVRSARPRISAFPG